MLQLFMLLHTLYFAHQIKVKRKKVKGKQVSSERHPHVLKGITPFEMFEKVGRELDPCFSLLQKFSPKLDLDCNQ